MTKLTIVAKFIAASGHEEVVEQTLTGLVAPTRAEAGCALYELNRSLEDPRVFLFYEQWDTRPEWEAHLLSEHIVASRAALEGLAEKEILQMERL